jgi:hypothetical protein
MRNFISFYSFCNYRCILKLIAPKNNNLSPFVYCAYLEIYTPSSAFFSNISFQKFVSKSIQDFMHEILITSPIHIQPQLNHLLIPFQEVRNLIFPCY